MQDAPLGIILLTPADVFASTLEKPLIMPVRDIQNPFAEATMALEILSVPCAVLSGGTRSVQPWSCRGGMVSSEHLCSTCLGGV